MNKLVFFSTLTVVNILFYSCEPDQKEINDPNAPVIYMVTNEISTAADHTFWIEANLSDDIGLKKVNLLNTNWYLDKDIELSDSARKEYHLLYKFLTPANAANELHTIILTVEDLGGNITSTEIPVRLNKDIISPVFKIKMPLDGTNFKTGEKLSFFIEVTDNTGIDTFSLNAPDLGIDTQMVFNPVNPRYIFVKDYFIPGSIASGTYFINLLASDSTRNQMAQILSITVGEVTPERVYCVGGASFGGWQPDNPMPMQPDEDNPGWFETITYSWGTQDYNNIKFIGQKSWGPLNWGLDPNNPSKMINAENSEAIVLSDPGYYRVRFNPSLLEYSTEKVEATTPLLSEMYILGSGITGMDMAWTDPALSLAMIRDPDNSYIFTATVDFTDTGFEDWGANFIFIGNKNNPLEFHLGFSNIPEESLDPDWLDYPGYVIGDLSMGLDPLTEGELSKINEDPPASVWNNVPYIAYYMQAGTYLIKMDYYIKQASITKVSK